jgi:site-specific DNA recombinase
VVAKVIGATSAISIELSVSSLCNAFAIEPQANAPATLTITASVRLTRTGRAIRLVQRDGRPATQGKPDTGLIELLRKGKSSWQQLQTGEIDIATIARNEKVNDSWVSRLVRLNFLAPPIVEAILAGTQPATVTAASLRSADLPIDWNQQKALFRM